MRVSDVTGDLPGVFIEDVAAVLPPRIVGVETSIAAFVGVLPFREENSDAPFGVVSAREVRNRFSLAEQGDIPLLQLLEDAFMNGSTRAVVVPARDAGDLPAALDRLERSGLRFQLLCLAEADAPHLVEDALALCRRVRAILILDAPAHWTTAQAALDNAENITAHPNAAMYFPRPVRTGEGDAAAPASAIGAIVGMIARNDARRGVWKTPAGTEAILTGFRDLSVVLAEDERARLNPLGINTLRRTTERGNPVVGVWGARLLRAEASVSPEQKYISVRRLTLFIEESIETGLAWAVFEPNGERLWERVRFSVSNFLFDLWREGAFAGNRPELAFFVQCDATTMTQADVRAGVLRVVVGFAALRAGEFDARAFAIRIG